MNDKVASVDQAIWGSGYFYLGAAGPGNSYVPVDFIYSWDEPVVVPAAPGQPQNLVAQAGNGQVVLTWDSILEVSYQIDRDGITIITWPSGGAQTTFTDLDRENGVEYCYQVRTVQDGAVSLPTPRLCATPMAPPGNQFQRGNCNGDDLDISDAIFSLNFQFSGGEKPECLEACNVNGGDIDVSDPIFLLNFLFSGGEKPADPFPACDTADPADCAEDICK